MTAATPTIPKVPDHYAPRAISELPANGVNNNPLSKVDYLGLHGDRPTESMID